MICVIINGRFDYKLYDKRDNYRHFRFPFQSSNIATKISAEVLRICLATKTHENFQLATDPFLSHMHNQGAVKEETKKSMKKLLDRHANEFSKYDESKKLFYFKL